MIRFLHGREVELLGRPCSSRSLVSCAGILNGLGKSACGERMGFGLGIQVLSLQPVGQEALHGIWKHFSSTVK